MKIQSIVEWIDTSIDNTQTTVGNTPGAGDVVLPGSPGNQYDFWNQSNGSGDKPSVFRYKKSIKKPFKIDDFVKFSGELA